MSLDMLQTLRNISPQEAQKVLVVLTESFLPNPFNEKPSYDIDPTLLSEALDEVKKRNYIKSGDESIKAKTKILDFLSNEIGNLLLTPDRKKKAKERLGQKGILPIKDYELILDDNFKYFEGLGLRESYIKNALQNAYKIYHDEDERIPVTMFAAKIDFDSKKEPYILLCVARRYKNMLIVNNAWHIYKSDLSIQDIYDLKGILKTFLNKYGYFVQLLNSERSKFISYVLAPDQSLIKPYLTSPLSFVEKNDENKYFTNAMVHNSITGVVEISYIYAVNVTKYIYTLNQNGVNVDYKLMSESKGVFYGWKSIQ